MQDRILGTAGVKVLEDRGIDSETAVRLGVFTGRKIFNEAMEYVRVDPDPAGNILVFPFIDGGIIVNEKYRGPTVGDRKAIWQSGGKRTFWNADIMDDPALERGDHPLIIVEGEPDGLTAVDCGFPFTVSVPDGAPNPPKDGKDPEPQSDDSGKFEFMWNNRDRLKRIKRFVIATDNDAPGKFLAAELVRRLSAARCYFVTYPEGCKDLNDVRQKHGITAVMDCLNGAKPYPVKDLHRLLDFPDAPSIQTFVTGWDTVDELFQLFTPCLMVATGIPSHGKSTFITNLLVNAAERYGWHSAIFSPEMPVVPHLRDKMRRMISRLPIDHLTSEQKAVCDRFINNHFVFIEHQAAEDDLTLEWLIERAEEAIMRYGSRVLLIDPWNEVEHAKRRDETMSEYIGRGLRMLKRFQMRYDVMVIVVAHPTKDVASGGKPRVPTLYDIDGCYSDDTEALTKRGWLHHGQITMSDDIACFDPRSGAVEYHQPSRIICKHFAGEMLRFVGAGYDIMVTPEHRMVVKPKWDEPIGDNTGKGRPIRWSKGNWHFIEADKIPKSPFAIPLGGIPIEGAEPADIVVGNRKYPIEAFLKLAGWFVSEGHVGPTGLTWSQAEGELAEQFTLAFAEAGIPANVGWQEGQRPGWLRIGRWYIGNRFCPDLVEWFGDQCGVGAAGKKIPESFFDLSPRLKQIFLTAYLEGDGNRSFKSWRAVTVSKRLRDDLQRLAVEIGIATNSKAADRKGNWQRQYQISFGGGHRREVTMRPSRNLSREIYNGLVWCLTVPTGAYFVRRNGRVMVSGNSAAWFNKPDIGLIIERPDQNIDESMVHVAKVRFEGTGQKGSVRMQFNRETSRYDLLDGRSKSTRHYGK